MASPILIPKKSTIADKVPLPEQLAGGEVSVNWADQVWHGKHPSTNAVVPIGAPAIHSHDELYSLDKSQQLELQNNGGLVLTAGANATTLTPTKSGPMLVGSTSDSIPVHVIRCLTQSEYDALGTYDANTLYFIK
jgi:hypothetical protein